MALTADISWREQYVSHALNRKFAGIIPTGLYAGFGCSIDAARQVTVGNDTDDHIAVVEVDGYSMTIRMTAAAVLQASLDTPYIVIDADYRIGAETRVQIAAVATPVSSQLVLGKVIEGSSGWEIDTSERRDMRIYTPDNSGHNSGLDADMLDGKQLTAIEDDYKSAIRTAITDLVDSSPEALNTLNELADALGNDPHFATTVTNELSKKLNANDYTAASVLSRLKSVDGAGSGLNADLLDGLHASELFKADGSQSVTGRLSLSQRNNLARIASHFSSKTTSQTEITFESSSVSNDTGHIIHESGVTDADKDLSAIHLMPGDNNDDDDYVSIHGYGLPETLKLFTSGKIETPGPIRMGGEEVLQAAKGALAKGSGNITIPYMNGSSQKQLIIQIFTRNVLSSVTGDVNGETATHTVSFPMAFPSHAALVLPIGFDDGKWTEGSEMNVGLISFDNKSAKFKAVRTRGSNNGEETMNYLVLAIGE